MMMMMLVVCVLDGGALRLWHRPGRVSIVLSTAPLQSPFSRPALKNTLSWRSGRSRRFCRVGSHTNISFFSTSARQESADLRYGTSCLRSALNSLWRAVNRTRAEIQARTKDKETSAPPTSVSQAPPSSICATVIKNQEQRVAEIAPPTSPQAPPSGFFTSTANIKEQRVIENRVTEIAPPTTPQSPPSDLFATVKIQEQKVTKIDPPTLPQAPPSGHFTATKVKTQRVTEIAPPTLPQAPPSGFFTSTAKIKEQRVTEISPPTSPQAPPFGLFITTTKAQEQKVTEIAPPTSLQAPPSTLVTTATKIKEQTEHKVTEPTPPTIPQTPPTEQATPLFHPGSLSVRLGESYDFLSQHINSYFSSFNKPDRSFSLGDYLNYSAFVGSCIRPLVPRFRTEAKSETTGVNEEEKLKGTSEDEEQRGIEDRARRLLLLQREKIIARVSVCNRTRALVQALQRASGVRLYTRRVEELCLHLLQFPESRSVALKEQVVPCLQRLLQVSDVCLQAAVREALALLGFIEPVKKRGVRILTIDGGGTRGLLALQTLRHLQDLSGKPVHQLFDYICGVSTGAILVFLLAVLQVPLCECEQLYRRLSSDVFKQNLIMGTLKMSWSHAYYDTHTWETLLKEKMGSDLLIKTTRNPHCPKVSVVSTVVNGGPPVRAYVFRNYNLPAGVRSRYRGDCRHQLWEAIRASSAAPGYFQEFQLGDDLHQDGGMLVNNPTALAIHECECLWPGVPLQCVVSVGTGRFQSSGHSGVSYTSLKTKLTNVISSATDTEEVHTMLDALLPPHTYFRFNPLLRSEVCLDESREEKLQQMQREGLQYLQRNTEKMSRAVLELSRDKTPLQKIREKIRALTV